MYSLIKWGLTLNLHSDEGPIIRFSYFSMLLHGFYSVTSKLPSIKYENFPYLNPLLIKYENFPRDMNLIFYFLVVYSNCLVDEAGTTVSSRLRRHSYFCFVGEPNASLRQRDLVLALLGLIT